MNLENLKLFPIKDFHSKQSLKDFDCGNEALNEFLSRYALKNDKLGIGKTFLGVDEKNQISGYFTLSAAQIAFETVPESFQARLPKYPIPAIRIARLAVDKKLQGKGVGKWLLKESFKKIIAVAEIVGLKFIIVDAKETSKTFYEQYGFIKFNGQNLGYFLPVETVRNAALAETPG